MTMDIRKEIRKVIREQSSVVIDLQKLSEDCASAIKFLSEKERRLEAEKDSLAIEQRKDEDNMEIYDNLRKIDDELYYVKNMNKRINEAYESIYEYYRAQKE